MKHKFIRMSQHWSLCKLWGGENDFFNLSVTQALLPNDNLRTSSGIRSFLGLKKMSMPYWIKSLYMCNHLLWSIDNFQSKAPSRIHCIYKQYLSHTNSLLFFEESKMDHQSFFLSCRLGCHCFRSLQLQMSIQYTNNAWGIKHGLRDWLKSRKKDNLIKFERKT